MKFERNEDDSLIVEVRSLLDLDISHMFEWAREEDLTISYADDMGAMHVVDDEVYRKFISVLGANLLKKDDEYYYYSYKGEEVKVPYSKYEGFNCLNYLWSEENL